jgi:hypothetical protein
MDPINAFEKWSSSGILLAADANKNIMAAAALTGTRKRFVITFLHLLSVVAAANAVQVTIGTVVIADLPASWPVGSEFFFELNKGLRGDAASGIVITPAVAGPRIHWVAEGYYET